MSRLSLLEKINLFKNIIGTTQFILEDNILIDASCNSCKKNDCSNVLNEIKNICQKLKTMPVSFYRISYSADNFIIVYDANNSKVLSNLVINNDKSIPAEYYLFTDQNHNSYLIDIEKHL